MSLRRPRVLAPALVALGALSAGCKSGGAADTSAAPVETEVRVAPVIAPVERSGLEIAWWITHDPDLALGPILAGLAESDQRIDAGALERLRDAGLRPVRLTESELLDLTVAATPIRGIDRLWIGLVPQWTPTRLPAPMEPATPRPITPIGAPTTPGALRLLLRSYLATEDLDPVLRIDITGQVISAKFARDRFDATDARLPRPIDAGPTVDALRATFVLRPGEVIVLVADAPDADWSAPAQAPRAYDPAAPPPGVAVPAPATKPVPLDAEDQPPIIEEPAPIIAQPLPGRDPLPRRTFGEAMFTAPIPGDPSRPGRLVLVLIPQLPERFELIPQTR